MNNNVPKDITSLPAGPWDRELSAIVRSRKIAVLIHDLANETIEHEFIIDYGNYDHRKFLGKLTYYAVTNKRSVETMDLEEWEGMK